jgi:hypothetical protein
MNDVAASLPELFAAASNYPASSGRRRSTGARHPQPSSNAASCAVVSEIRPVVSADGHTNWPRSSRLVQIPTQAVQAF